MALSPMMQQYMEIKETCRDCILFFRLGDFYEMFFDDAIEASRELELTLTGKNCGLEERAPMCGVPYHSAEGYIGKLVAKGYKVAICEQTEDPAASKSIVKREIVRIVTPGTATGDTILSEKENNYLASVYCGKNSEIGFSYCDISTGELNLTELPGDGAFEGLLNELARIGPKELLINERFADTADMAAIKNVTDAFINILENSKYTDIGSRRAIGRQFSAESLTSLGFEEGSPGTFALGAQIEYLLNTQKQSMAHMDKVNVYNIHGRMTLDKATIRNLELTETIFGKKTVGSLLGVLDKTNTAMGGRKIKKWLKEPLRDPEEICERLDAVETLVTDEIGRNNLRESLKAIYDFERLIGKVSCGSANGRDMVALKNSLFVLPEIKLDLKDSHDAFLRAIADRIHDFGSLYEEIDKAIVDDPPFTVKEGRLIKKGYSHQLDSLKESISDSKNWIVELEENERKRTGIKNLKVGFNKVFGYYIEVSKSNLSMIPDDYIRKQTLVNGERFVTPQLKETEDKVLNAETTINRMEYEIFTGLREYIKNHIVAIQETSAAISDLDVIASFAHVSDRYDYVKPHIDKSDEIIITKGRHPVIEQTLDDGIFVANDTYMDRNDASMLLITGPNMSGKSTYMRQTALIVLMAQAGCFVPCERAKIGVVDRIFTRIGASDNLSRGESTFYVEMSELAHILNSATGSSLVILDEIGRGTSTYDGLSIAWAVTEYLTAPERKTRTMFASHYHELTDLEGRLSGFKNLNVNVIEENGEVVFLHRITEGSASKSYGIQVARLAGVPKELLNSAQEKLEELEERQKRANITEDQLSLF